MPAVEDSKKLFGWDVKGVSFISTTPKCYWPAQTCKNFYKYFWFNTRDEVHWVLLLCTDDTVLKVTKHSTHWPHLIYNAKHCEWYYTVPYFPHGYEGRQLTVSQPLPESSFSPYFPKRWYIQGDSKREKILHSKHLISHDRVSSVKWQIDNLSVRDMASLELANKGSWGEYSLISAV